MREGLLYKPLLSAVIAYAAAITASNLIPLQLAAFATAQRSGRDGFGGQATEAFVI